MGMFDDKVYLTGENGVFKEGDEFLLESAAPAGMVTIGGQPKQEVVLTVRKDSGEQIKVYTAGSGIVNQVLRMEAGDLPTRVRLATKDTGQASKMFLLEKAQRNDF